MQQLTSLPLPIDTRRALTLLGILTLSRTGVAFQFQSITLLIDGLRESLSFSATGFGILLGLYMAPGAVMAIASPVLVRKYGASTTVACALLLMAAGQVGLMLAPTQAVAYLSRLVAGTGGCIIYIATIDLAARLCSAGTKPGRMGVIAASWPLGNALSLVVLGVLLSASLPDAAGYLPAVFAMMAALLCAWALSNHRLDPRASAGQNPISPPRAGLSLSEWKQAFRTSLTPGITFALYNVSFIVFISFSPDLLRSQGYTPLIASNIASLPMWLFVASVPLGGLLAGKSQRKDKWLVGLGCLGGGACIVLSHLFQDKAVWYLLAGILGGLPTGAMLASAHRARHDLFYPTLFFIFFVFLLLCPPLVGAAIETSGHMYTVLVFCVATLVGAFLLFNKDTSS
jgi:MFS family permease